MAYYSIINRQAACSFQHQFNKVLSRAPWTEVIGNVNEPPLAVKCYVKTLSEMAFFFFYSKLLVECYTYCLPCTRSK